MTPAPRYGVRAAHDALDLVAGIDPLLQEKACPPEGGRYEATAKTNSEQTKNARLKIEAAATKAKDMAAFPVTI